MKKLFKEDYRYYILLGITFIFGILTTLYFDRSYVRIFESIYDLITSILFYITELIEIEPFLSPSVNEVSTQDLDFIENLFIAFESIIPYFKSSFFLMFNLDTLFDYLIVVLNSISNISKLLLILFPFILILIIKFREYLDPNDNLPDEDSTALIKYKNIEDKIFKPIKDWFVSFIEYLLSQRIFVICWIVLWCINFNIFTIIIEFISFYLYFIISFDFINILMQLYKLILDLYPMFSFLPTIVWIIIAYKILSIIRKNKGYNSLDYKENSNRKFINTTGQLTLIDGEPGTGKTTLLTDFSLSIEIMFRDEAYKRILNNDLKFPNFPWINFENYLKRIMEDHVIYNLASIKYHINYLSYAFNLQEVDVASSKAIRRNLRKKYGYKYNNLLFGYDYEKYGLFYDDNLDKHYIWDVLKTYAQLYFIYIIQCSLIVSNYSIRVDNVLQDLGNFPIWNSELFRTNPDYAEAYSRHAHILDFDMLRLGKKIIENNEKADVFEFGIVDITEVGKERGNMLDTRELKKNIQETNQKNDLFNNWVKMARHNAMVDNFPFIKILMDDQRAESLGVDVRQLCQKVVYIRTKENLRCSLLFFGIDVMFYEFFENIFKKFYLEYRYNRSDNTLLLYLFKKFFSKLYKNHMIKCNTFGYNRLVLETQRGSLDKEVEKTYYYLMHKKIYSKRFASDAFSDFFSNKALKSKLGLEDLQEFRTERGMEDEFDLENSYMINEWFKYR